jgi:hypothetical protein
MLSGGEPISLYVPDYEVCAEVCAATPSAGLAPYQSEYEGYMQLRQHPGSVVPAGRGCCVAAGSQHRLHLNLIT